MPPTRFELQLSDIWWRHSTDSRCKIGSIELYIWTRKHCRSCPPIGISVLLSKTEVTPRWVRTYVRVTHIHTNTGKWGQSYCIHLFVG